MNDLDEAFDAIERLLDGKDARFCLTVLGYALECVLAILPPEERAHVMTEWLQVLSAGVRKHE